MWYNRGMNRKNMVIAGVCMLLVVGLVSGAGFFLRKPVTILVDGKPIQVTTWALTTGAVLKAAGIPLGAADQLSPALDAWITFKPYITLDRAVPVRITVDGKTYDLLTTERRPSSFLTQAGITLNPGDALLANGLPVDAAATLPLAQSYTFQVRRPVTVTLNEDGHLHTFQTTAVTLGQALWQNHIQVNPDDALSPGLDTPLTSALSANLHRAIPLVISLQDIEVKTRSSAATVGAALALAGLALQNLDYSQPAEDQPLPADGRIRVLRVREEVLLDQKKLPFETKWAPDPNTELDLRSVVQPGQEGILVTRTRIRYEDGQEVNRQVEGEYQARPPQERILGYGTKVVVRTEVVEGVAIEYWRKVTLYATSYSPCNSDADRCYYGTASGLPVKQGVAGVKKAWYGYMVGSNIFVPGYGAAVIADFGAGYPDGRAHIDLGYSDSDYVPWHSNVAVYFLTPVPPTILWILQ